MKKTQWPKESDNLFVYGTLRIGFENEWAKFLHQHAVLLGSGYMNGKVYDLGNYPGAVYEENASTKVPGEVFALNEKGLILKKLDEYEGVGSKFPEPNEYVRRICPVSLEGKIIDCWVYLFNH